MLLKVSELILMSSVKNVKINFEGRDEILKIIDSGGFLVKHLLNENSCCPLIGSKIKFVKRLGRGTSGTVFLVEIKGMHGKEYAVKKIQGEIGFIDAEKSGTLREIIQEIPEEDLSITGITKDEEEIIKLNGGNPNKYINESDELMVPEYSDMCKTKVDKIIIREKDNKKITIPKGSYLCLNEQYSEYVIGILAGNFYRQRKSVNFIDVFKFETCHDDGGVFQYIFMEKIDNILDNIVKDIEETSITSALIQTLHALVLLQTHKINHNDLHLRNVFIEYITKDSKFNGQTLYNADYFHYVINGIDLYIPSSPFLIKMGDFGLSFKWKSPIVGNKGIAEGDFKYIIPNWYSPNYDSLFFIIQLFINSKNYPFLTNLCAWTLLGKKALKNTYDENKKYIMSNLRKYIGYNDDRPRLNLVDSLHSNPTELLTNKELMKDFLVKPKGKIVTLGEI